jgi:hypothetical protein
MAELIHSIIRLRFTRKTRLQDRLCTEHVARPVPIMSIPANNASRLIRIIREQHGFDDHQSTPSPAVRGLRASGKLERAFER